MKRIFLVLYSMFGLLCLLYAEEKVFIREYVYQASEDDSKNSAKAKTLVAVRKELLDEIGVYIESYANLNTEESGGRLSNFYQQEIKTLTAGISELVIIDESWDGKTYYVRARITVDPQDVLRQLTNAVERRKADTIIDSLKTALSNVEVDMAAKDNRVAQLTERISEQTYRLDSLGSLINDLQKQSAIYARQEAEANAEVAVLQKALRRMTDKALSSIRIKMTIKEMKQLCGYSRSSEIIKISGENFWAWNYGGVWVITRDYSDRDFVLWGVTDEDYERGNYSKQNNVLKELSY